MFRARNKEWEGLDCELVWDRVGEEEHDLSMFVFAHGLMWPSFLLRV